VAKAENLYANMRDKVVGRFGSQDTADTDLTESEINTLITSAMTNNHFVGIQGVNPGGTEMRVAIIRTIATGQITLRPDVAGGTLNIGSANLGALIFADGPVLINGNIKPLNPANGFLALIALGNISLGDGVLVTPTPADDPYQFDLKPDSFPPSISGIFYTQGTFSTGSYGSQLKIEGTIVGLGLDANGGLNGNPGILLQRNSEGKYPAELVKFNPRYTAILMEIGLRRKVYFEQSIP
jgi:hypothetical protein